ncbi:GNAT family N-acetyltransferase [Fictibacillus sp. Mic-4]|uniref:GNAT family N-acetyltransferase n=1 Tax=Fictibacillus sp. Mic-4 TaxID=3132826 RepID=UPI003CF4DF9D
MDSQLIEELSLNSWQPLSTLLYDGWVIRFANGYTKRANSISPIYYSTYDLNAKIEQCEQIYLNQGLLPAFKITPFVKPENLDEHLNERDYSRVDLTSVQTAELKKVKEPVLHSIKLDETVNTEWVNHFYRLNHVEEKYKDTIVKMLSNIATKKCLISLYYKEEVVACGLGVIEREHIGLYDIVTDSKFRRQGFAEQLILNLLKWGKEKRAKYSYLAVLLNNNPALKLYAKIGFTERYRYWYRVKNA